MVTAFLTSIPVHFGASTGTGDFWVAVLAILAAAVAVTVALVLASPARKATPAPTQKPTMKQAPTTTFSKAA